MSRASGIQKLLSTTMAVLLVILMVPATPQKAAHANQQSAQEAGASTSLITSWTYYSENLLPEDQSNSFEQKDAVNTLFNSSAEKPSATSIVQNALTLDPNAFDQAMIDVVESEYKDTAKNFVVNTTSASLTSYESVDPSCSSDDDILSVDAADNGVWTFTATGAGSATVNVLITKVNVRIPFTYDVPAASEESTGGNGSESKEGASETETKNGTIDVTVDCPSNTLTSYTITITDGKQADLDQIEQNITSSIFSFTYGDNATERSTQLQGNFGSAQVTGSEEFFFSEATVSNGELMVVITPKKAFEGEKQATLTVYSANEKDSVSSTIKVTVSKKTIEPPEQLQLDYRFAHDQLAQIKTELEAEDSCKGVADEKDVTVLDIDAITYVNVSEYPGENGGTTAVSVFLKSAYENNYELSASSVAVKIDAVEEEEFTQSTLALTAEGSVHQPKSNTEWLNTWVNQDVAASYANSTLSKTFQGEYSVSLSLNNAEGAYSNQTLYVKNNNTHIVSKVGGIGYKLDKTAPVVASFSVSEPYVTRDKIFFDKTVSDVVVSVVDSESASNMVAGNASQGTRAEVSGLDNQSVEMTYFDSYNEQSVVATISQDGNSFKTTIDADQDVVLDTMTITANDVAGNEMNANTIYSLQIPDEVRQLVADSAAPQINVSFDNNNAVNGSYYHASRTATITVTEAHFNYVKKYAADQAIVTITENGESRVFNPGSFTNIGNDTWQVVYTFGNDADYSIHVKATDLVGKESESFDDSFTVDTIAPTIDVVFDNNDATNGNYYSSSRTATITVVEHNFSSALINVNPTSNAGNGDTVGSASVGEWSSSGDTHVITVNFPGEGVYSMTVSGTDLAENALPTYACQEFIVDNITPTISVQVNDETDAASVAYSENASVTVTVSDTNISTETTVDIQAISWNNAGNPYTQNTDTSNTQIAVSCTDPASVPESDGIYSLTVNAIDMAGHSESKVVQWSVNRFGSTYLISSGTQEMINAKYLKADVAQDVSITEINPSGIDESQSSVRLTQGIANKTLNRDSDYTIAADSESNGWPAYVYSVKKANYESDGMYQFTMRSVDKANNASENTMSAKNTDRSNSAAISFAIDNTAPVCSFVGFDQDTIASSEHEVQLLLEDNMQLETAKVYVNRSENKTPVATYSRNDLDSNPNLNVTLNESGVSQKVEVEVADAAGNQEIYEAPAIFVNSSPLARWVHNTPLFIGSIVGVGIVVALIVFGVMYAKRRKNEQIDSAK